MGKITVWLDNDDDMGNNVSVYDLHQNGTQIWSGRIDPHGSQDVYPATSDAGYAHIETSVDGNPKIGHDFLQDGAHVSI